MRARDTLALYVGGVRAGRMLASVEIDSAAREIALVTHITVEAGAAGAAAMELIERRRFDSEGNLRSALQTMTSAAGRSQWRLIPEDGRWRYTVRTGGQTHAETIDVVRANLRSARAMRAALLSGAARKGDRWLDTTFELTAGAHMIVETVCERRPDSAHGGHWVFVSADDVVKREERWVLDRAGRTIAYEAPPLYRALRDTGGSVAPADSAAPRRPLSEMFTVAGGLPGPGQRLGIRLDSTVRIHDSVRRWYESRGDTLLLRAAPDRCRAASDTADAHAPYLASTAIMQVGHPDIIAAAASIRERSRGRCDFIKNTVLHVYRTIEKRSVTTFSNAVETLHAGFGDCGEHAALCAALLRAGGVEARLVLGLVFMPSRGAYLYHAWVTARAGQWLFADPALGEYPATGGYIPLVIDDTGRDAVHLAALFERLRIHSVPARPK